MVKRSNPFRGRWRIISTDVWDSQSLDEFEPARLIFGSRQTGELNFIAINASVDYRIGRRDGSPIVEFSWAGDDDGTPISGRGWAQPNSQGLVGRLFIHDGDETGFAARRLPTK